MRQWILSITRWKYISFAMKSCKNERVEKLILSVENEKKIHCHTCFPLVLHPITNTRRQFWYAVNSFSPVTSQSCCLHKTFTVSAKLCRKILYSSNERLLQLPYLAHLNTVQHRRIWRLRCIYSTIIWHNMAMHSVCRKGWSEHGQLNGKVATS